MRTATRRSLLAGGGSAPKIHSDWWNIGLGYTCLGAWSPITAGDAAAAVWDQTGGDNHLTGGSGNTFIKGQGLSGSAKYQQNAKADYWRLTFCAFRYDGGIGDIFGVRESGRLHFFYPYDGPLNRRYWGLGNENPYVTGRLSSGSRYTVSILTTDGYLNTTRDYEANFWVTGETTNVIAFNGSNGEGTSYDGCSMLLEACAIYSHNVSSPTNAGVVALHNAITALRS